MANIPSIKRFRSEDYPGMDERFLSNLNTLTENIVNGFSGNLNTTNVAQEVYERKLITKNTSITPSIPLKLSWVKSLPPAAVWCGGIWLKGADPKTSLGLTITIDWDYDSVQKLLLIKKINGLTLPSASNQYEITIYAACK